MTTTSLSATSLRTRLFAYTTLIFLAAIWGATFFAVKDSTKHFSVMAFLTLRFTVATIALIPIAWQVKRWPTAQEWRWGFLAGTLMALGYIFQTFALRLSDSGRVGFITGLYVVLVPALAFILLRYSLKWRIVVSTVLALVGLTLLSYAPGGSLVGDLLACLGALSFACQILAVEKFPTSTDWRHMSFLHALIVTIFCGVLTLGLASFSGCELTSSCGVITPFAALAEPLPASLELNILFTILFTGILASAAGLLIQVWAQRLIPPSDAALIYAMESPFSAIFGAIFLAERMTGQALFGCGLIMLAMLTVTLDASHSPEKEQHYPTYMVAINYFRELPSKFRQRTIHSHQSDQNDTLR